MTTEILDHHEATDLMSEPDTQPAATPQGEATDQPGRYARLDEQGRCVEFVDFSPFGVFPPTIRWQRVPDELSETVDHDWRFSEATQAFEPVSLDVLKAKRKREATQWRKHIESRGILLPNGVRIATTKDDQDRLSAVVSHMERYDLSQIDFKADSGWVALTRAEVSAIGAAVVAHVQACFSAERTHHEALELLDSVEAVLTHDVSVGWPPGAP